MYFVRNNKEIHLSFKNSEKQQTQALTSTHKALTHTLSQIMKNSEDRPQWLAYGITYLLAKVSETNNPKNYRPITCLSTPYKLLTSIITECTNSFPEQKELLPCKQKGSQKESYGSKDQLLINRMIIENCQKKQEQCINGPPVLRLTG